jgi:hypothetical protein
MIAKVGGGPQIYCAGNCAGSCSWWVMESWVTVGTREGMADIVKKI